MTGLIEQLTGASFSAGNILIPPLPAVTGVTALWCYPGTDLAHSQNLMGAPAITQLGSPTYQPAYVSCTPGATPNALDTGILDDASGRSFSLLFAARHTGALDAQASVPMNNNDAGTLFGISTSLLGSGSITCGVNGPSINLTLPVIGVQNWHLYGVAYNDASPRTMFLFNLTEGTQTSGSNVDAGRALSAAGHMIIGASPRTAIGARTCDIGFAGWIKGQVLTYAQAQQFAPNIRANCALRGLIVP